MATPEEPYFNRDDYEHPHGFKVGDGATMHIGSDATAWTVIAVTASGKTITLQGDVAKFDDEWKPDIVPGGFAGHCVNQQEQRAHYIIERNPDGPVRKARLTQRGWKSNGTPVSKGRHPFYDYNF
jgi:hypothetical protein